MGISRHRLKSFETQSEPVAIRTVLDAARQMDGSAVQTLQSFEHWAVFPHEQPLGNVQLIIRVDTDQMSVEGRVMDFRKRDAIWNHRLAELLVLVRNDVGRVQ